MVADQMSKVERDLELILKQYLDEKLYSDVYLECGFLQDPEPVQQLSYFSGSARIFDLASLTKALVTTPILFSMMQHHQISRDVPVSSLLPQELSAPWHKLREIKLWQLLAHQSGLPAWRNFYTQASRDPRVYRDPLSCGDYNGRKSAFTHLLQRGSIPVNPDQGECYSDVGFILLGILIEEYHQKPLNQIFYEWCDEIGFWAAIRSELGFVDALTQDTISTGYCHIYCHERVRQCFDENAVALGQVCGHAGLFASGPALGTFLRKVFGVSATGQDMLQHGAVSLRHGAPVLGLRVGDDAAAAPFGDGQALGHYGFTGTSFWLNPKNLSYYLLLTNRTKFNRLDPRIRNFRKRVATIVAQVFS